MENNLFDVDFSQIADQNEGIDLSSVITDEKPAGNSTGDDITFVEDTPPPAPEGGQEPAGQKKTVTKPVATTPTGDEDGDGVDINEEGSGKGPGTVGKSSPVTPFASFLQEKGFLPNLDIEEFKKAEDPMAALADAWGKEVQIMQQQLINSFPPELIDMARAVASGVPLEALKDAKIQELNYSRITDEQVSENTDLQRRLVGELLHTKGFKPEKIKTMIDTFEDSGKLEAEATDALGELKTLYKQHQEYTKQQFAMQQKQFEQQHAQRIQTIQKTIQDTNEIIPGMNLTEKAKKDLFANMTQIVAKGPNGEPIPYVMALRSQDPMKFDLAVTYLAQTTKGFTDWSKITNKAKTSAAKELEAVLEQQPVRTTGASKQVSTPGASADLLNSLNSMFGGK